MSIFLRLKHWQVFSIWIAGLIFFKLLKSTSLEFLGFTLYTCLLISWIFSIGKILNERSARPIENYRENVWVIIYGISIMVFYSCVLNDVSSFLMVSVLLPGIISFIKVVNFSAKVLKQTETGQPAEFKSYILDFFLIMYMIIGLWTLQPRLNKMVSE